MTPELYITLFASFVTFSESLLKLRQMVVEAGIRHKNEAAAYFKQLADAMTGVVANLRANVIPTNDGHEMQSLIRAFPEKTKSIHENYHAAELEASLQQCAAIAITLDAGLLQIAPPSADDQEKMLAIMEGVIGECRAMASVLRTPG